MYLLYKKPLETCLDTLNRLKNDLKDPKELATLTYAGRLDPLARGLILALSEADLGHKEIEPLEQGNNAKFQDLDMVGPAIKDSGTLSQNRNYKHISDIKQAILDLPKTYEFEVVFGVATDTFDQLGIIYPSQEVLTWKTLNIDQEKLKFENLANIKEQTNLQKSIENILINKDIEMYYPFFSSKTVDGKSLFDLTKEIGIEKVNKILPKRNVNIFSLEIIGQENISVKDLVKESIEIAKTVKGDFRQDEIIESWEKFDKKFEFEHQLPILKFRIVCSSGFYVRSFACWLGQIFGNGAIARDIYRTQVGNYIGNF